MKSSAVYLLLLVLCISSNRNIVEGFLFDELFDYIYEYFDYSSDEEGAVATSSNAIYNETALHDLIMKLCGISTTTTTTKPITSGTPQSDATAPTNKVSTATPTEASSGTPTQSMDPPLEPPPDVTTPEAEAM